MNAPAPRLMPGARLYGRDGWAQVEAVEESKQVVGLYNVEVEGSHTYFVGGDEWGSERLEDTGGMAGISIFGG